MVFIQSWDEAKPAGQDALLNGDNEIRAFKTAIRERLAVDHYFLETESGDAKIGYHKTVSFVEQASDPSSLADALILYSKLTGSYAELYGRHENAGVIQLTHLGKLLIAALGVASEARGDIITRGASAWGRLGVGASGRFVRSDGTDPVYSLILEGDIDYTNLPNGAVLQVVHKPYTSFGSTSNNIPADDSIPQSGEGAELFTQAFTPKEAGNKIVVLVFGAICSNDTSAQAALALFKNSDSDALAVGVERNNGDNNGLTSVAFKHEMEAADTAEITFKVRGGSGSGTFYINGRSGARLFGGALASGMTIMEVKA